MKRFLTALVLIPLVLVLVFLGPKWLFTLAVAAVAALDGWAYLGLVFYCTFRSSFEQVMADAAVSIFCLLYVGFTLIALPTLREETNGPSLLVFLMCVVWAGDIAAFYVGRDWGRHKLASALSPNKTWEGALGSVAGSLLVTGGLLGVAALL